MQNAAKVFTTLHDASLDGDDRDWILDFLGKRSSLSEDDLATLCGKRPYADIVAMHPCPITTAVTLGFPDDVANFIREVFDRCEKSSQVPNPTTFSAPAGIVAQSALGLLLGVNILNLFCQTTGPWRIQDEALAILVTELGSRDFDVIHFMNFVNNSCGRHSNEIASYVGYLAKNKKWDAITLALKSCRSLFVHKAEKKERLSEPATFITTEVLYKCFGVLPPLEQSNCLITVLET